MSISLAALLVKVICQDAARRGMAGRVQAMRVVSIARLASDPAPARISVRPAGRVTAASCSGFRPCRRCCRRRRKRFLGCIRIRNPLALHRIERQAVRHRYINQSPGPSFLRPKFVPAAGSALPFHGRGLAKPARKPRPLRPRNHGGWLYRSLGTSAEIFDYDNILLLPRKCCAKPLWSDAGVELGGRRFRPLVVLANMKTVVDEKICARLRRTAALYVMHRFLT